MMGKRRSPSGFQHSKHDAAGHRATDRAEAADDRSEQRFEAKHQSHIEAHAAIGDSENPPGGRRENSAGECREPGNARDIDAA